MAENDYGSTSGTLIIPAGSTSATIQIIVYGDNIQEEDEQFLVQLSSPVNAEIADATGVGTIIDNDDPVFTLSAISEQDSQESAVGPDANSTYEGDAATYVITLSGADLAAGESVTLNLSASDGSALYLADYGDIEVDYSANSVSYDAATGQLTIVGPFSAGAAVAYLAVDTVDDVYQENNETFTLALTGSSVGTAQGTVTTTIVDDEDPVTATLSSATDEVSDLGGSITYTITLTGSPGEIDPDTDLVFELANGETITIAAGEISGSTTVKYSDAQITDQSSIDNSIVGVLSGGNEYEKLNMTGATSVAVIDTNSDPEFDSDSFDASYAENSSQLAVLTTVSASDADGDTLSYSITQNVTDAQGNDLFTIDSVTGEISLTEAGVKSFANDYEQASNDHLITVAADDGNGGFSEIEVTLSEEDVANLHVYGDNGDNVLSTPGGDNDILVGDIGGVTSVDQVQDYHIALILDVSASMDDDDPGLQEYKAAVEAYIDSLSDYAGGVVTLGLVTFANYATDAVAFDLSTDAGVAAAKAYVNDVLEADGNTNYEAGLASAYDWLSSVDGDAVNQTVFISDGRPNRFLDNNGNSWYDLSPNGSVALDHATGDFDGFLWLEEDNVSEVDLLKSLGTVYSIGVRITDETSVQADALNTVATGDYIPLDDVTSLADTLVGLAPTNDLKAVGADEIDGGMGNDLIFGDTLNTDILAQSQGIDLPDGSGLKVFQSLENGEGTDPDWSREDTLTYIRDNYAELAVESGREGGDDLLSGGAGDDIIFGQEGDDILIGGSGDDLLDGGSGADTFRWLADDADSDSVPEDTISDFNIAEGDVLDLGDLLQGESYDVDAGGNIEADSVQALLDNYIELSESGGNVEIAVRSGGAGSDVDQKIVLENTSLDALAGSPGGSVSEADALAALINNGNLSVDPS